MLSPSLAQEIAADTSAVIGFNVLITDSDGMVIGSGDTSRVGTFHDASIEVVLDQPHHAPAAGAAKIAVVRGRHAGVRARSPGGAPPRRTDSPAC
ncbi:sugar diacid recognition domain-containing protein [Streptomyces sp. NPDC047072]|uniref:sugar diacid recognition domain-containing protein n=1 Tax=Streptomyces sp. NPDC047072 TaxID=3154809 RepID=UPI0033EAD5F4